MPFNIIRHDITKLCVDAIVNAANSALKMGGGVCGSIFNGAGIIELQEECDKIGHCKTGEAVITNGYNLNAKYIVHTVGPVYGKEPQNEANQLYNCYRNSLNLAKKYKLKSIAFPLISSGIYGYPKDEALKIATSAIKEFLQNEEMDIYLVVYDKSSFVISRTLYEDVKSYIEEREVKVERRRVAEDFEGVYNLAMEKASEVCPKATPCKKAFRLEKSLEDILKTEAETFSQMMLRLIDEKGMNDVEVYKRANIDRKLFSKMRKKDYCPKKATVMAVIIALRLNMKEARELLSRAGYAFSVSSKSDIIIEYFIENKNYDIFAVNETLFEFDQPLIGA